MLWPVWNFVFGLNVYIVKIEYVYIVKIEWWISHFEIKKDMDKINFLSIRNSCIFLTYQTTYYNSIYRLRLFID
jgi:hypothetical protein